MGKSMRGCMRAMSMFIMTALLVNLFSAFLPASIAHAETATTAAYVQEDFEGGIPSDWSVSTAGGSVVVEPSDRGDQALHMKRTSSSGETAFTKTLAAGELTDIVTIEADIMKDDTVTTGNSWASVPYVLGSNGNIGVSFAFSKGEILAYNGASSQKVMNYEQRRWYHVQLVMDLNTQTFDLSIDGVLIWNDTALRQAIPDVKEIKFYANGSQRIDVFLDNIRVTKGLPVGGSNAELVSLTTPQGALTVSDSVYTLNVPYATTAVQLIPTAASPNATIQVKGQIVESGKPSQAIALAEGENVIDVAVTSEDKSVTRSYQVVITRAAAPVMNGTSYYVDASGGDDSNEGTSESAAWKSLSKVNATIFQPGDRILFKAGQSWTGQLHPKGVGKAGSPITIDQYGSGDKPKIQGAGQVGAALYLYNQSYWEIYNLDVSNQASVVTTIAEALGDFRGIHITGDNGSELKHFRINGVDVHDVTGEVNWIGGTIPDNPAPGINFKTGWDRSKRTGGIIFDTSVVDPANPGAATTISDVIIENSTIMNTSFGGIIFKQYAGSNAGAVHVGWGERESRNDPKFTPHTNIIIRNNYINQHNTEYGCNGIYVTGVRGALVEGNVIAGAGTVGIEMYYADDVIVQFNEVYETRRKAGGADHNGIDPDKATTNIIIQYNYIHDTGDGILICQFGFGDTVIRYNVIEDTERYPIYLHSDRAAIAEVYNNTIYNSKSKYMIYGYGSFVNATYKIENNILYSTRNDAVFTTGGGISYNNNSYYGAGFPIPSDDTNAITQDPMLTAVNTGGKGTKETGPALNSLTGYRLKSGSPLIGAGIVKDNHGGRDIAGNVIYHDTPDIGAVEYYGAPDSSTESITGKVKDTFGNNVVNAQVSIDLNGETYSDSTDQAGYFSLLNVPVGIGYTVKASKPGYKDSSTLVNVEPTNTRSNIVLSIEPATAFGGVKGMARDGVGDPLEGVRLVLTANDQTQYTALSDSSGQYIFENVVMGTGYSIQATKEGHHSAASSGIEVTPGYVTTLADLFLTSNHSEYLVIEDFEAIEPGSIPQTWMVSTQGGMVEVVEAPDEDNHVLYMKRDTNSGRTSFKKTFAPGELSGIVTLEADIMRHDTVTSSASWVSVPYISGSNGQIGVSFAFSKGKIVAYNGGASQNIMDYEVGKWYNVQIVMNIITKTFDLYIDGEKIWDDAPFRNPITDIGTIEYYAESSNKIEASIDNVRIIKGEPYAKDEASLEVLSLSHGELIQVSETHFTADVGNYVKSIQLTPKALSDHVTLIQVNGQTVLNQTASPAIPLQEGETEIEVVVTAEDGVTSKTYTVVVTRTPAEKDTTLAMITLSSGELTPAFSPEIVEYTVEGIAPSTKSLQLAATTNTETAGLLINGIENESGQLSGEIPISDGATILVRVTAQDGTAYRDYKLTVRMTDEPEVPEEPLTFEVLETEFTNLNRQPVTQLIAGGFIQVSTLVKNVSAKAAEGTLIVALYNAEGSLVNVSYIEKTIDAGTTEGLKAGFKLPGTVEGHEVRVFVWDSLNGMKPLSAVTELE
jgi:hypothetical protein